MREKRSRGDKENPERKTARGRRLQGQAEES
jgi:hypothetical protein